MIKKISLFFLIITALISCKNNTVEIEEETNFAIYLLKDENIKIKNVWDKDINSLELAARPWIKSTDIEYYDWSANLIYLKKDKYSFFPDYQTTPYYTLPFKWRDRPFILRADKKSIYMGYLSNEATVFTPVIPEILSILLPYYPDDVIYLDFNFIFGRDPRKNDIIKKELSNLGILKEGITVEHSDTLSIINGDTATVVYDLIIKNNDNENLYFLDPEKTGSKLYQYHNVGPEFLNINTRIKKAAYFRESEGVFQEWKKEWYTLLEKGKSIKRRITLKGYPRFEDGDYIFQTSYNCPHEINKTDRKDSKGIYWMGRTRTEIMELKYKNEIKKENRLKKLKEEVIITRKNNKIEIPMVENNPEKVYKK